MSNVANQHFKNMFKTRKALGERRPPPRERAAICARVLYQHTVTAAVACAETVDCMYVYVKPVSTAHFVCIGQNVTKI